MQSIVLELDVTGHEVALIPASGGLCDGVVRGTLSITRDGGGAESFDVKAPTVEEHCPNCLPSRGGSQHCPCEWVLGACRLLWTGQ
jgi:hypothetical protein